ncbi:hypothetical protein FQN57_002666 [Myotisia sp. PD_48]|nr:hypothetical protein FQN57_002666 [Myotisia sp. PD_48]
MPPSLGATTLPSEYPPLVPDPSESGYADQRHNEKSNNMAPPGTISSGNPGNAEYHSISTSQKMISATWGSLLTSVLVTPLDVVRVRLQSQTPVIRAAIPSPSAMFKELPPNLGVSACCREVFWAGDNAQFCIANPTTTATTTTTALPGGIHSSSASSLARECAVEETKKKSFTSTMDGIRKIARNEGTTSLWRGLSPTLAMAIPANVIYFTGYDWLRYDPDSPIARHVDPNSAPLVAGAVARIAAASVISPIEMFRTRLQATSGIGTDHFKATLRGLHQMTLTQGYSSLWRGLTLTMWRDVPFSGLYWWGYEAIRTNLVDMRAWAWPHTFHGEDPALSRAEKHYQIREAPYESKTMVFVESFTAGAISGALAALVTTPFDVGKTRQQVFRHDVEQPLNSAANRISSFHSSSFSKLASGTNSAASTIRPEQLSIPKFLLHIFREEGTKGLFRGWAARCLKVAPACAIMISSYEVGKKMAGQVNERRNGVESEHD